MARRLRRTFEFSLQEVTAILSLSNVSKSIPHAEDMSNFCFVSFWKLPVTKMMTTKLKLLREVLFVTKNDRKKRVSAKTSKEWVTETFENFGLKQRSILVSMIWCFLTLFFGVDFGKRWLFLRFVRSFWQRLMELSFNTFSNQHTAKVPRANFQEHFENKQL